MSRRVSVRLGTSYPHTRSRVDAVALADTRMVTFTPAGASTAWDRGLSWYTDRANVGEPTGGTLPQVGAIMSTTTGQVIENVQVNGQIVVTSNNVTIRNCRVLGAINRGSGTNTVVDRCDINRTGHTENSSRCINLFSNFTVTRCRMWGMAQGVNFGGSNSNCVIEDNYIFGIVATGGDHCECILSNGGEYATIQRNWLDSTDPTNSMGISGTICLYGDGAPGQRYHTIVGNLLMGNRGYLFYPGAVQVKPIPYPTDLTVTDNVIDISYTSVGSYGELYPDPVDALTAAKWARNTRANGSVLAAPGY